MEKGEKAEEYWNERNGSHNNFYTHKICNYCFDSVMGLCNFVWLFKKIIVSFSEMSWNKKNNTLCTYELFLCC